MEIRTALAAVIAVAALFAALRFPRQSPGRRITLLLLRLAVAVALVVVASHVETGDVPATPPEVIVLEERAAGAAPPAAVGPQVESVLHRIAPLARVQVRTFSGPDGPDPGLPAALGETLARRSPGARTIVLLSGRPAAGDTAALLGQAVVLGRAGVPVLALAPSPQQTDARIRHSLSVPRRVFPGERYDVRVLLAASRSGRARVELFRDGALEQSRMLTLTGGVEQDAAFPQTAPSTGPVRYRTLLRWDDAAAASGEQRLAAVEVAPPLSIEYVTGSPAEPGPLPAILRHAGMRVAVTDPESWMSAPEGRPGVVIFDDLPAAALGDAGMERLERRIRGGAAGLLVVGGIRGLGSGEYRDTLLERLLPVTMGPPPGGPDLDVGLAIVLDTSLSMFFRGRGGLRAEEGPRKIEVARLAVLEVVRALRPNDRLGLLASNDQLTWIRRPGLLDNREDFASRVRSLGAIGGGINFYSSLREAAAALREVPTKLRHVMVVADSDDIDQIEVREEGRSEDLVRGMAAEGITLSIFAIGFPSDKDVLFLKRMTSLGRGDFYLVPDLDNLPRFFRAEYQRRTGEWYREESFAPLVRDFNPLLRGIDLGGAPPLGGLDLLAAKSGAEEVLVAPFGTPLLALWGYGRGRTAVFASDRGDRWASGWNGWNDAERFWSQTLYALAPEAEHPAVEVRAEIDSREGFAVFRLRRNDGTPLPAGEASVGFGEPAAWQPLARRGVERYEAPLPDAAGAAFRISGPWPPGTGAMTGVLAPPAAGAGEGVERTREILGAIADSSGGAWLERVEDLERHLGAAPVHHFDPVFWLLLGSLAALAVEAALRD